MIFGEMGLMEMRGRSATIRAHTDVRLLRLEGQRIEAILKTTPALLYRFVSHLSARLRETDQAMIRDLTEKNQALETAYHDLQHAQAALIDKARLDREMALAQELQRAILPRSFPQVPGFDIVARGQPAREVGGDFYDLIPLDEQHVGIVMADVSDKGVYAGMFMTMCHALIHAEARRSLSPATVLQAVHRLISGMPMTRMFVTVVYAVLDLETQRLTYARAGHEYPLLIRADGAVHELDGPGMLLSASLPLLISDASVDLVPGDLLLLYTDGVTEATAPTVERYGDARLKAFARSHATWRPMLSAHCSSLTSWPSPRPRRSTTILRCWRCGCCGASGAGAAVATPPADAHEDHACANLK